ncbi:MAG: hypothetical protein ACRD0K_04315 [Egibacteraceae bacterium]
MASDDELLEALLAAAGSDDLGPYCRLLEEMDERARLFLTLRLIGTGDLDWAVRQTLRGLEWTRLLDAPGHARCADELSSLLAQAAATPAPTIQEQQRLAERAEGWCARWRRAAEQAGAAQDLGRQPARQPGSAWRLRIDRPPLAASPIVDGSERHLATVFSKLVVDDWLDLERTDTDRWRIRVGDVRMLVSVDGNGQAARVLVDTPPQPQAHTGRSPAFRIRYVRLDGEDPAHIQVLDPQPDLAAALPTARLWEAGPPWSILCGRGQDAAIEEVTDPEGVCRACKRELARITELVDGARWEVARRLASPEIEVAVRARLHEVPF